MTKYRFVVEGYFYAHNDDDANDWLEKEVLTHVEQVAEFDWASWEPYDEEAEAKRDAEFEEQMGA